MWFECRKKSSLGYSYVYELCSNQATFGECFHGDEVLRIRHSDVECELWNLQARGSLTIQYIVDQLKSQHGGGKSAEKATASPGAPPLEFRTLDSRTVLHSLTPGRAVHQLGFNPHTGFLLRRFIPGLYGYSDTASYDAMYSVAKDSEDYGNEAEADADQLEFPLDSTHQYRLGCLDCVAELLGQNGFAYCMLDNHSSGHACQLDCLFVCQREKASEGWKLIGRRADYFRQEFTNFCRHFARKQRCQLGLDCPAMTSSNVARFIEQARQSLQPAVALIPPGDEAEEQQQVYYGGYDPGLPAARPASLLSPDHSQPMVGRGGGDYLNSLDDFNDEPPQPQTASLYSAAAAASASASQSPVSSHTGLRPGFAAALPAARQQQQQQQGAKKSQSYLNSLDNFDEPAPLLRPIGQKFAPPASAASIISPLMEVKTSASGGFPINAAFPTNSRRSGLLHGSGSATSAPRRLDYDLSDRATPPPRPAAGPGARASHCVPALRQLRFRQQAESGSEYYNCRHVRWEDKCLSPTGLTRTAKWNAAVESGAGGPLVLGRRCCAGFRINPLAAASTFRRSSNSAAAAWPPRLELLDKPASAPSQQLAAGLSAFSSESAKPQQQSAQSPSGLPSADRRATPIPSLSSAAVSTPGCEAPIIVYSNSGFSTPGRPVFPNPNRAANEVLPVLCQNSAKTKQCRYGV
uniref:SH2 domain-containing protein n=1 Tax=Macrostomum lignano TaxID=282301 RepID=A0A1I8F8F0_9PLAT